MNVIQPLIDLQDVDGRIRDLEREARDIPQRKAQETARLAGVNAALEIAKNQLGAVQLRIKSDIEEAEQIRARVSELKIGQLNIKSNKEMQQSIIQIEGLEKDAEAADNRAQALEEDEIPRLQARVEEAQAKVDAERGGVDGLTSELDVRLAEVKAELAELAVARKDAVAKVPPSFLLYYERLRTKRWPVVVMLNGDDVCDGCHMQQPPFVAQNVEHVMKLVFEEVEPAKLNRLALPVCTMCGRVLYRD